jgi:hypothetical protein
MQFSVWRPLSDGSVIASTEASGSACPALKNFPEILEKNPVLFCWRPPVSSSGAQQLDVVLFFSCSNMIGLPSINHQSIDDHPQA